MYLSGCQEPTVKSFCSAADATGLYSNSLRLILRNFVLLLFQVLDLRRQHGYVIRVLDLKSGDTGFKFCSGAVSRKTRNFSGDIILFVSSKKQNCSVAQNFAVIVIFTAFTTYKKNSFTE